MTDEELKTYLREFRNKRPVFAVAGKGGKFPIGQMRAAVDGASIDIKPLTHACDQITFDAIADLMKVIFEWCDGDTK